MITVVSAVYGAYDVPVAPLEQDVPVRWVMVTDGQVDVPAPWESIVEPRPHLHPRMAAKVPKCLPHRYSVAGDVVIWLDASAQILRPDFVSQCAKTLGDGDVAMWLHPQRNCILDEAFVSSGMAKYEGQPVYEQVGHYIACGHPRNYGLWATGCMAWRRYGSAVTAAGAQWLTQQTIWTYQDQLSWPLMVAQHKLDVRPLPGGLWDRTWVVFRGHASEA